MGSFAPPKVRKPPRLRRRLKRRGEQCLNCATVLELAMHYCPQCGQENVAVNISIWDIFREAVDEFARFDSKFVHTVVPLVLKPGQLTREWADGRRTRYVSPLKLYLTITFFFFLIAPYLHPTSGFAKNVQVKTLPDAAVASAKPNQPAPHSRFAPMQRLVGWAQNPTDAQKKELLDQFIAHAPTAIFAMLPVYAGALWILYIRNGRYYVEHLVFALHCHSFYFLLLLGLALLPSPSGSVVYRDGGAIILLVVPIYSILALKRNYGQGWFKTLFKSMMLAFAYLVLLALALVASLMLAATSVANAA